MADKKIPDITTPEPPQKKYPLEEFKPNGKNKKKLGVALVGLGTYSTGQLMPALEESKLCYLAGIVTGSPEKAEKYSTKYTIPSKNIYNYDNFDSIKDNRDIDIVYIVLPNSMHAEYAIRAAKAGKHVICEKPMAVSVIEGERMINACKEANKMLFIGYRLHFEPHNLEAMRLGQQQILGPVKKIEASFGFDVGEPGQWRLIKEMAGGGSLVDVGIYTIQAVRYVSGKEPVAIRNASIEKSEDKKFKEVESGIKWEMELPDGVIAHCTASYTEEVDRLHVETSHGWFKLSPAFEYSGIKGKTSEGEMSFPEINQQTAQLDGIADSILNSKENKASGEEGLKDLKIMEAIYKAVESGQRIELKGTHAYSTK